jgi:hypothetical protein
MKQQNGVLATRSVIRFQHGFDPRAEIGHARIHISERARRAHGGAGAATHAKLRRHFDVIAARRNRTR